MSTRHKLSRRAFLKVVGAAASVAVLEACVPQASEPDVVPTATVVQPQPTFTVGPTATPVPTPTPTPVEIEPIVPEMVLVKAGSFEMGSADGRPDEQPVHTVTITYPFYVARYAVTFDEYDLFYLDRPGGGVRKPDDGGLGRGTRPVEVTWSNAVAYCNWLSEKGGLNPCYSGKGRLTQCDFAADGYRLPTEVEWEYAARGGQKSQGYTYAGSDNLDDVAWYADNSGGQLRPVGQKQPNELGLYDMSGNTWEWCWDWYGKAYYASSPASDPRGPASNPDILRVKRGGRAD
ncbi:MAG: formylglycine-generating enzyme family protein, partial [Promethearchaeota archaeon]